MPSTLNIARALGSDSLTTHKICRYVVPFLSDIFDRHLRVRAEACEWCWTTIGGATPANVIVP